MKQRFKLINGDCLEQLSQLPADFFDASLSDPPYGFSFMGKEWDKGVPSAAVYSQLLRVLKPGAFGLAFGGTRTFHRLAVNIEDAGAEIRDCLSWLYGSGFPKSHNISKAIDKAAGAERVVTRAGATKASEYAGKFDQASSSARERRDNPATEAAKHWNGYGTALKPAWEPCLLFQKPLDKTFANNALTHGCGGLNIDGSRVGSVGGSCREGKATQPNAQGWANMKGHRITQLDAGRFPANLLLDEEAAAALDATQPRSKSRRADEGGVSRFFYTAKTSTSERNAGLADKNDHPTLKPLSLNTYLAKLLLVPPRADGQPRRCIVPFSGSGSEIIGALLAGWDEVWGIELSPEYVEIARARVKHWCDAEEI